MVYLLPSCKIEKIEVCLIKKHWINKLYLGLISFWHEANGVRRVKNRVEP